MLLRTKLSRSLLGGQLRHLTDHESNWNADVLVFLASASVGGWGAEVQSRFLPYEISSVYIVWVKINL